MLCLTGRVYRAGIGMDKLCVCVCEYVCVYDSLVISTVPRQRSESARDAPSSRSPSRLCVARPVLSPPLHPSTFPPIHHPALSTLCSLPHQLTQRRRARHCLLACLEMLTWTGWHPLTWNNLPPLHSSLLPPFFFSLFSRLSFAVQTTRPAKVENTQIFIAREIKGEYCLFFTQHRGLYFIIFALYLLALFSSICCLSPNSIFIVFCLSIRRQLPFP